MRLVISTIPDPIDEIPEDLAALLDVLAPIEGASFALTESEYTFLRGEQVENDQFLLQYSNDSEDGYHEYKTLLDSISAAQIANRYASGDSGWKDAQHWEHVIIAEGEEPGSLGFFDGVGLKQVISELERNDLDVRVEPLNHGFMVFTTEEHATKAKQLIAEMFPM